MTSDKRTRVDRYVDAVVRWRWLVIFFSTALSLAVASGAQHVTVGGTYRVFFGPDNPQLMAVDAIEGIYGKGDHQVFVIHNPRGSVFEAPVASAVQAITTAGWQTPYATRVDSLTNYQHSWAVGDDLVVEDLIPAGRADDAAILRRAREVVRSEPALHGGLVSLDEDTTIAAVRVLIPPELGAVPIGKAAQGELSGVAAIAKDSRRVLAELRQAYPDLRFELTGTGMLQAAFTESPILDASLIFPSMLGLLVFFLLIRTRSIGGSAATLGVVVLSTAAGIGATGFYGYGLNPVVVISPMIILTLSIADSVHILSSMAKEMRDGVEEHEALRTSIAVNLKPVFLTSLTTMVGFLVMNLSDAPPFQHLGNITATGVAFAWLLSMTFLPAALSLLPLRASRRSTLTDRAMEALAAVTGRHPSRLAWSMTALVVFLAASVSMLQVDDFPHRYFDETNDFRRGSDFIEAERGLYDFSLSARATSSGGINDPGYLEDLERFEVWLRDQPKVVHVRSYAQTLKRINRVMHADDPAFYQVPTDRELAAQYLLLYEMSLPFGLDLNDSINVDRSATKVDVLFREAGLVEIKEVGLAAVEWLKRNAPHVTPSPPTSYAIMFAYITERNIASMLRGTVLAFLIIAAILLVSLRSPLLGAISLVPNIVPALAAFGIWALVGAEANFGVSVVACLSIGIIVDDTVHLLSKYALARQQLRLTAEDAVRYAFVNVGPAIVSTSIIVVGGFGVLTMSSFQGTVIIGALTSLTVACALIADFFLLPPLLILLDGKKTLTPATAGRRAIRRA